MTGVIIDVCPVGTCYDCPYYAECENRNKQK